LTRIFLPPVEIPTLKEELDHLQHLLVHLIYGNKTNSEVILAAYPKSIQEFLVPSSSFIIRQLSQFIQITDETNLLPLELYLEKMLGSIAGNERATIPYSPNWYILFSSLRSEIEIPLLVWNTDTLNYLLEQLQKLEESLDFARQLRFPTFIPFFLLTSSCLSRPLPLDTRHGIRDI
jgi:hypothetical protein